MDQGNLEISRFKMTLRKVFGSTFVRPPHFSKPRKRQNIGKRLGREGIHSNIASGRRMKHGKCSSLGETNRVGSAKR